MVTLDSVWISCIVPVSVVRSITVALVGGSSFYAGAGIAANSLKHNGASDKALKPVFTFGKKKKFSSRLSINLGVIYQQVELSTSNITSNNTISSNTETGLAEALAAAGTTTETTTTSSNEAVALVTSWLEQHTDRDKIILLFYIVLLLCRLIRLNTQLMWFRIGWSTPPVPPLPPQKLLPPTMEQL